MYSICCLLLCFLSYAPAVSTMSLFHTLLLTIACFAAVLVMACCILFSLLRISIFKDILINTPFSPLSNYSIYVLLHMGCSFFMCLIISQLFIFPSCSGSTHHLSPCVSHLLSKQLGFLNSRLWQ